MTGVPVAWMLSSSRTTATVSFFVSWVRDACPEVRPNVIMSDRDLAQIAALQAVYPTSRVFLCKWHVLRAMRKHFSTTEFPELWDIIKKWVNTDDLAEFHRLWEKISTDPSTPKSFQDYLTREWMPQDRVVMWSKTARKNRSIYEEGDTNMLIEAYVNAFFIS
jgi:hypothetical protein